MRAFAFLGVVVGIFPLIIAVYVSVMSVDREIAEDIALAATLANAGPQAVLRFDDVPIGNGMEHGFESLSNQIMFIEELISYNELYSDEKHTIHEKLHYCNEMGSGVPGDRVLDGHGNGLVHSILYSYNHHLPLVLRPDDIWHAIMVAFGRYVEMNADTMRHLFVSHDGKKQVNVMSNSRLNDITPDGWSNLLAMMQVEIGKYVRSDIMEWMIPSFSTTTEVDKIVSNIAIMSTMKEYFSYSIELSCGLTTITLKGTHQDWLNLVEKTKFLHTLNQTTLSNWANLLSPVLQKFADSYDIVAFSIADTSTVIDLKNPKDSGNSGDFGSGLDMGFWRRICTSKERGSGGQRRYLGGFTVFAPFDKQGKYQLRNKEDVEKDHIYAYYNDDSFPVGYSTAPVTINDNGDIIHTKFIAGSIAVTYNTHTKSISPSTNWAILITNPPN